MNNKRNLIAFTLTVAAAAGVATGTYLSFGASATAEPRGHAASGMQTIDAKTDPAAAAKAINDFCQVIANCQFVGTAPITVDYDAYRVLGDALYNCGQADAEDEVTISDERSESWSFGEAVSTKVKLGFIGLAAASIEAEVNSKQLDEVATTLKQANSVSVAPGTIGYTETRVPTAYLTGDADITSGVNIVKVTHIELTYPGYGNAAVNKVDWRNVHQDMTALDRQEHCAAIPPLYPIKATSVGETRPSHLVVVCTSNRRCTNRRLIVGVQLSIPAGTKLTLARGRVIYALGSAGKRGIVLSATRQVRAGAYTLLLSGQHASTMLEVTIR
jgi:hypothetical protein